MSRLNRLFISRPVYHHLKHLLHKHLHRLELVMGLVLLL
jgi:hypothetical protein